MEWNNSDDDDDDGHGKSAHSIDHAEPAKKEGEREGGREFG